MTAVVIVNIILRRKHTISSEAKFDFLKDLVANIADIQLAEEEGDAGHSTEPEPPRPRGRGRCVRSYRQIAISEPEPLRPRGRGRCVRSYRQIAISEPEPLRPRGRGRCIHSCRQIAISEPEPLRPRGRGRCVHSYRQIAISEPEPLRPRSRGRCVQSPYIAIGRLAISGVYPYMVCRCTCGFSWYLNIYYVHFITIPYHTALYCMLHAAQHTINTMWYGAAQHTIITFCCHFTATHWCRSRIGKSVTT